MKTIVELLDQLEDVLAENLPSEIRNLMREYGAKEVRHRNRDNMPAVKVPPDKEIAFLDAVGPFADLKRIANSSTFLIYPPGDLY